MPLIKTEHAVAAVALCAGAVVIRRLAFAEGRAAGLSTGEVALLGSLVISVMAVRK